MAKSKKYSKKRGEYKNGFEAKIAKELRAVIGKVLYEPYTFHYKVAETRKYTPDFFLVGTRTYIEGKGKFTGSDRKKMLLMKEQHPGVEFRFYFVSGNKRLSKVSKTTYGDWCDKHGFKWCDLKTGVPKSWKLGKIATGTSVVTTNQPSKLKSTGTSPLSETPGS